MAKRKQQDTKKESGGGKSRNREVMGILILCLSVFVFLALATYNAGDWPGSSRDFGEPTKNLTGRYGAFISYKIYQTVGITGFFLVGFLVVAGIIVFLHRRLRTLVKPFVFFLVLGVFLPQLLTILMTIGAETTVPGADASYGGMLGALLSYVMVTYLGRIGAFLLSLAFILVTVVLTTNIKPSSMVDYALKGAAAAGAFMAGKFGEMREARAKSATTRKKAKPSKKTVPPQPVEDYSEQPLDEDPFITPVESEEETAAESSSAHREEPTIHIPEPMRKTRRDEPVDEEDFGEDGGYGGEDAYIDEEDEYDEGFGGDEPDDVPPEEYEIPTSDILDEPPENVPVESRDELLEKARHIVESLNHFNIEAEVRQITPGPIVTRYELTLAPGVKVGRVVNLSDDLAMALKAKGAIRILAPIPGKAAIGIEVPNRNRSVVYFRDIVESEPFAETDLPLLLALGKNTAGEPIVADLAKMPHLLIAGSTGSGKSVCINTIISSILLKAPPDKVRMLMIDPKVVELSLYNTIPHLLAPVITDPGEASNALKWAVGEMEARYRQLAALGVRDIGQYNAKIAARQAEKEESGDEEMKVPRPLPYIVVIVDEFADLMVVASNEVEEFIARLAQMARAVGIHLVLATQRPSSDVITGLIKANFPSRIAFKVMQASNSRIILDQNGADKLLGMGDMLFLQAGKPEPVRLHGAFISSEESSRLADFTARAPVRGIRKITEEIIEDEEDELDNSLGLRDPESRDALFFKAARLCVMTGQGSVSLLQRRLKIGYARAARLVDQLELAGIVTPFEGSKAREVMVDDEYIDQLEAGEIE